MSLQIDDTEVTSHGDARITFTYDVRGPKRWCTITVSSGMTFAACVQAMERAWKTRLSLDGDPS